MRFQYSTMIKQVKQSAREYVFRLNNGIPRRIKASMEEHEREPEMYPVYPKPAPYKNRIGLHVVLFVITLGTTTWAGGNSGETVIEYLISGVPYSATLLSILLVHEFGHFFAARKFGVTATLPFFIPFPSLIGTMGAVIKTKSPIPDRKALLYIGAMGPLPGFVLSLAAVIYGIHVSSVQPIPAVGGDFPVLVFGDSLLFKLIVTAVHGPVPRGQDIMLSQYAWAGWIGFLITGLNLMPIGQLDGAHILYALVGRGQRVAGWAALIGLIVLSFVWNGWIVWIVLTLSVLMVAHPYIPETRRLSLPEKIIGWFCMAVLVMTFIPVPVEIL